MTVFISTIAQLCVNTLYAYFAVTDYYNSGEVSVTVTKIFHQISLLNVINKFLVNIYSFGYNALHK